MKKLLFALLVGITSLAYSQVPQGINYQSVVRSTSGAILPSTAVTVEFKLYDGLSTTLVYHETHSTTTNSFGMVNLIIGQGSPLSGSFNSIPWSTTNGIGYEVLVNSNLVGSKQLFMSVPYALHAGSAPAPAVSFTNNILSVGGNTTSITSGTTYTAGNGISISGGIISNTLVPITPTITGGNNITINPSTPSNSYTVSAPSYSLSQSGNNIDLLQNGTSIGTATLPIVSSYSAGSGISIVGNVISNTLTPVTPTLSVTGNSISINPGNTQALPNYSLTQSGANIDLTQNGTSIATVTLTAATSTSLSAGSSNIILNQSGNAYTITPVTPTFTNSGPTTISGSYPNYTVNSVASPTTSLVAGNLNLTLFPSGNTYTLDVKSYSLTANSNTLTLSNGASITTATVPSSPSYSGTTNNISITSNSINLVPTGVTAAVYGANATNAVPTYSVDNFGRLISSGQYTTTLSGDVLGAANTTTVTKLQTRPVSNTAPTANQVLTWNGSAWTPSSTVVPVLSYTGSATAGTLQSGAQTVTIPNYTLSNTSNTISLNNGTANSTAIIPVPTLTLSGTTLQSGPATNTVSLSGLGGIYSGSGSIQTGSTTVTVGTNTLTFLSGATLGKSIANFFGGGITGTHLAVGHTGANASAIKLFGSVSTAPVDYGYISGSSNGIAISGGTSTNGLYATNTAEIGVGTYTTGAGKFVVTHAATQANPTMHLRETSGALSRIKFSNTGVLNRFFEAGASVNAADNFSAYSISFHDGTNYKSRFLIYGDGKTSINNMHTALTTFHVMDDNATSPGIATEGFGFAGQMNLTRNNPLGVSPTYTRGAVFGGQEIGKINFAAHDGTNYGDGAKIYARTAENVTTGTRGTELIFAAVPTGTNTNKDAFKINGVGNLEVISGLRIPLGSVSGHVLTSDAIGNASWQPITAPALAWVSSAGTTTLVNNTDKVGIGTNTPSESLDVNGNINVPNTTASSGIFKMGGLNFIHAPSSNLFFGIAAGNTSLSGFNNVGIGQVTMQSITTGANNVGLGYQVMQVLTQGSQNIAIGTNALSSMSNGNNNTALGFQAGNIITNGSNNLFLGYNTNANTASLTNASAIGALARVDASNSMILGSINGINGATASTKVGIGTTTPQSILEIVTDGSLTNGLRLGNNAATNGPSIYLDGQAQDWTITGSNSGSGSGANKLVFRDYTNAVDRMVIDNTGKVGIGTTAPLAYLDVVSTTNTIAISASSSGAVEAFSAKNTNALATAYAGVFEGGLTTKGKSNTFNDYAFRAFNLGGTSLLSIRDDAIAEFGTNVGINVLNPANRLHVNSSYTNAALLAENIVTGSFANAHGVYARVSASNTSTQAAALYAENLGAGAAVRAVSGPTVTGGSNVALLLDNGHMKSVGITPTFTLNALASGTGVIGTDMVGKLSFTVLLSAILSNTDVITVKFDKPYSTIPNIIIIPNNGSSYAVNAYVNAASVNGFSLRFANNSAISTTYSFNYLVIE